MVIANTLCRAASHAASKHTPDAHDAARSGCGSGRLRRPPTPTPDGADADRDVDGRPHRAADCCAMGAAERIITPPSPLLIVVFTRTQKALPPRARSRCGGGVCAEGGGWWWRLFRPHPYHTWREAPSAPCEYVGIISACQPVSSAPNGPQIARIRSHSQFHSELKNVLLLKRPELGEGVWKAGFQIDRWVLIRPKRADRMAFLSCQVSCGWRIVIGGAKGRRHSDSSRGA